MTGLPCRSICTSVCRSSPMATESRARPSAFSNLWDCARRRFYPAYCKKRSWHYVAFDRPGAPLLLQFKLGEALQRLRRQDPSKPPPVLGRPFWRFNVDTAEPNGQFDLLLKAEQAGAEVYYVAPRFTTWDDYVLAYESDKVLDRSLLEPLPNRCSAYRGRRTGWPSSSSLRRADLVCLLRG
jgi:hypothetical protein